MNRSLRSAILGGAAVLALSAGAAFAASTTTTTTTDVARDGAKVEKRVVIMRSDGGENTVVYDSEGGGDGMPFAIAHGGHGPDGMGPMGMRMHHGDPEHAAKHLREVLQLTPAQEPALQAFLTSMHPPHDEHEHGGPGMEMHRLIITKGPDGKPDTAKMKAEMAKLQADMEKHHAEMEAKRAEEAALTTPQRLDRMVKHMAEESAKHQAEMQTHVDAVKRFYAALTPSQQKAFDALHEGGMGEMHGGPGGPGMRVMHMGMAPMPPMPPLPPLPPAPPAPAPPPPAP